VKNIFANSQRSRPAQLLRLCALTYHVTKDREEQVSRYRRAGPSAHVIRFQRGGHAVEAPDELPRKDAIKVLVQIVPLFFARARS